MKKFQCSACGRCCSNIRGFISEDEKRFIKEYGYGKMPLIQVIPPEKMTFPLWDFEVKRFKKYAKELNIDAKIKPSRGVFDLDTNQFIIVTYHMDLESCPFLNNNRCTIYEKRRSLICYLYPFNKSSFFPDSNPVFGSCSNIKPVLDYIDKSNIEHLHKAFGDSFLASIQHDYIMQWSNKLILELTKEKKIRPAMSYPYDKLLKRINNSEKIDLTGFLIQSGYKSREEVDSVIRRFENYKDAKEQMTD